MTCHSPIDQGLILDNSDPLELSPTIFQLLPIGVFYESWEGAILKANLSFCRTIGYTENQLQRLDSHAITHPDDFALELTTIQDMCQAGEKQQTFRKRFIRIDGSYVYAEVTLLLVGSPDSDAGHILVFVKDLKNPFEIEAFNRLQTFSDELEAQVRQRTTQLEESLRLEQLIRQITANLHLAVNEQDVLQTTVEGVLQAFSVMGCFVQLLDDRQQTLEVRYYRFGSATSNPSLLLDHPQHWEDWSTFDRHQLLNGQFILRESATPDAKSAYSHPDPNSPVLGTDSTQLLSPLLDHQGLLGILTLLYPPDQTLSEVELGLIQQIAKQCAIAIRQARLLSEEHQQRFSAAYFRQFLEKSSDVFVEYDTNLRYISINPVGCTLLGCAESEILGKTDLELLGTNGLEISHLITQALTTGESVYVNYELELPTGCKLFETVYTPIPAPDGSITRVVGVCRDISEFRRQWQVLETQNHQLAENTRLKEEFMATTSHELRTPLTAILGFSNVLLQEFFGELNAKQREYITRIHGSGQHLLDLINDILDLSRIEADRLELDFQLVFLGDIYENVLSLIQEKIVSQNLTLEVEVEPDLEYMIADPRRLKQMLLNLLTNAVKFTVEGTVGLKIYRTEGRLGNRLQPIIHFQVWDTGIGIPEADQKHLFTPFSQIDSSLSRRQQGTGLGLVITRKLAEIHGGCVEMASTPGEGSCFTLSLPLYQSLEELG